MARFVFRLLTPHLFFFAVMMYLIDLRMIAVGLAAAGIVSYLIAEELSPSD